MNNGKTPFVPCAKKKFYFNNNHYKNKIYLEKMNIAEQVRKKHGYSGFSADDIIDLAKHMALTQHLFGKES